MHDQVDVLGVGGVVHNHVGPGRRRPVGIGVGELEPPQHRVIAAYSQEVAPHRIGRGPGRIEDRAFARILSHDHRRTRRPAHRAAVCSPIGAAPEPDRVTGLHSAGSTREPAAEVPRLGLRAVASARSGRRHVVAFLRRRRLRGAVGAAGAEQQHCAAPESRYVGRIEQPEHYHKTAASSEFGATRRGHATRRHRRNDCKCDASAGARLVRAAWTATSCPSCRKVATALHPCD